MMTLKKHILWMAAAAFAVSVFFISDVAHAQPARKIVQTTPFDLNLNAVGIVDKILKPDTIRLDNGKVYKLDNIRVPFQLNDLTTQFLEQNLLGKKVGFYIVGDDPYKRADRFGHTLAHVVTEDGSWVQAQIVSRGLAWATVSATSRDLAIPLFKYEDIARSQASGLWALPEFAIRDNDTIGVNSYNSFQIYQGKIKTVTEKDNFIFINFGKNPQTDFTISFYKKDLGPFQLRSGAYTHLPVELIGQTIRIRGWVEENGGPMMQLECLEQLEFPDTPEPPIVY